MTTIVIPLHHGGGKFKDDSELRFALRSIAANFSEDSYKVAIVGRRLPSWVRNVKFIEQRAKGLKTALKMAAEAFPAGFHWFYDDCCLLRKITAAEMKVTPCSRGWSKANTSWARKLEAIRQRLVDEGRKAWDYSRPHGPYWFDKSMIDEAFRDWPGMDGKLPFESWILSKRDWPRRHSGYKQYYGAFRGAPGDQQQFLNYNNAGFTDELRAWLSERFPDPCPFEAVPGDPPPRRKIKLQVHTLRFGESWWVKACVPSLDQWCSRWGHDLQVWKEGDIDPSYPAAKFCEVDMLKRFLESDAEWMIYVDADVFVHPTAPEHPDLDRAFGFLIRHDRPSKFSRHFPKWCARHFGDRDHVAPRWTYCNAGVWACDRLAAKQLLANISPPYIECVQEQHHWNWWLALAQRDGMVVQNLPPAWNAWPAENDPAAFFHLCGRKKSLKWNSLVERGLIPSPTPEKPSLMTTFDFSPFSFTEHPNGWDTDDMHIHLLHLAAGLPTGTPGGKRVAVEIGAFRGKSTSALITALNQGKIDHLHVVEIKPTDSLRQVLAMADDPRKVTLHTTAYWDLQIGPADFVFVDGDHRWPAVGDTLRALTWGAKILCLHDTQAWPRMKDLWGSHMAARMLKDMPGRTWIEDAVDRSGMRTFRGLLISAENGIDIAPLKDYLATAEPAPLLT